MNVGRRELLTGLAAVAVAGVVPALPASAVPYTARYTRDVVLGSHWHYDEPIFNHVVIRHLETGLTFVRRPLPDDRHAMALAPGEIEPPGVDAQTIQVIARAARWVGVSCCLVLTCRPEHQGAVFFRYRPDADPDDPYYHPVTEDAPPLPRFPVRADANAQIRAGDPAPFVRTALHWEWQPNRRLKHIAAATRFALVSRWHVDIRGDEDATYRHSNSGLLFAVYPERPGVIWLMRPADQSTSPHHNARALRIFGMALVFAHYNVFPVAQARRCGRDGSFIVDYAAPDYDRLVAEDAPPLPRVERLADAVA